MRKECIQSVEKALGRALKAGEADDIERRIMQARSRMAFENTDAYRQMTEAQQITAAGEMAAKQVLHETAKKHQRQTLSIVTAAKNMNVFETSTDTGAKTLLNMMRKTEQKRQGIERFYFRDGVLKALEAVPAKFAGMMHDMESVRAFVREVYGEASDMPHMKGVADSWLKTAEDMRERINNAGGDVGKLDYAYLPQNHNQLKVLKAGKEAWVNHILPLLDRRRYLNEDGSRYTEDQMIAMLGDVYSTITTGGLNKVEPGQMRGNGGIKNRHSQSRALHFKDADSHLAYAEQYGRGNIMQSLQRHVGSMARDIALLEDWGPSANSNYRTVSDMANARDGVENPPVGFAVTNKDVWNTLSGTNTHPANVRFAEIAQGIRNIQSSAKLGGAVLSSFTDIATMLSSAWYNRVPAFRLLMDLPSAMGSAEYKEYANRIGLMSDTIMSEMNRWTEGNLGEGWTSKVADLTFRVSLLNAWTDGLKRAFAVNMTAAIGNMSRTEWGALHNTDRLRLQRAGIDESVFNVWREAQVEQWRGQNMLTADSIMALDHVPMQQRLNAAAQLLGYIQGETDTAVTSIDLLHTARMGRAQKGEAIGEIARTFMQFKSFPASLLSRQLDRIADVRAVYGDTAAAIYVPSLILALTGLGAMSMQAKSLAAGKDPRDMSERKFWMQAFVQGGGLGIYGDILNTGLGGQSRGGQPNWTNLAGPVFGTALDVTEATLGNIGKAYNDRETNVAAGLVRIAKSNLPLGSLWYTRAAMDHLIWNRVLDEVNPGYLQRVRRNARNDTGQDFWWRPDEVLPERAPNFAKAARQ